MISKLGALLKVFMIFDHFSVFVNSCCCTVTISHNLQAMLVRIILILLLIVFKTFTLSFPKKLSALATGQHLWLSLLSFWITLLKTKPFDAWNRPKLADTNFFFCYQLIILVLVASKPYLFCVLWFVESLFFSYFLIVWLSVTKNRWILLCLLVVLLFGF